MLGCATLDCMVISGSGRKCREKLHNANYREDHSRPEEECKCAVTNDIYDRLQVFYSDIVEFLRNCFITTQDKIEKVIEVLKYFRPTTSCFCFFFFKEFQ